MSLVPPKPMSKIGVAPSAMDRNQASASPINASQDSSRSDATTWFTRNDGKTYVVYNGDRRWAKVTLVLETAGPVSAGTRESLGNVTSGTGILLTTGVPQAFVIAKGTKLYVAASTINRLSVQVEPLPWLEEILAGIAQVVSAVLVRK